MEFQLLFFKEGRGRSEEWITLYFWMFTFVKNQAIQGFEKFSVPFMILEWREKNRFEVVKILFSNQRNESDFNNISWKMWKNRVRLYIHYTYSDKWNIM